MCPSSTCTHTQGSCSSVNVVTLLQAGHPRDHTSIPGGGMEHFAPPKRPGPTQRPVQRLLRVLCASSNWCVTVTSHPHLVPRLRVNGALPPVLLYALMACTRTPLLTHCGSAAQFYSFVTSNYILSAGLIFVICCGFQVLCHVLY